MEKEYRPTEEFWQHIKKVFLIQDILSDYKVIEFNLPEVA